MGPFIDGYSDRKYPHYIGHHTNWGINASTLVGYMPNRTKPSERLRLHRAINKQRRRKEKRALQP